MGEYQFEVTLTVSEIVDIDADSYEEALAEAQDIAESGFYVVSPEGYSIPWDYSDVSLLSEPDEDED